jgi:hypothetical protein
MVQMNYSVNDVGRESRPPAAIFGDPSRNYR